MSLVIPHWNKDQLKRGHTLYGFTKELLEKNRNRRLPPTRTEVETYWALRLMEAFPDSDDPTRVNLLEQKTCPLIEEFWEKRADEEAFEQKCREKDKSRIYISDRRQTRTERKRYPYAVLMWHPVLGEITVPSIQLIPLHQLSCPKIVRKIIDANPTKALGRFVLQEIWEAILTNIYAYEYKWREEKKTECIKYSGNEIQNIIESKKRKRSEAEERYDSDPPSAEIKQAKLSVAAPDISSTSDVPQASASRQKTQKTSQSTLIPPRTRSNNPPLSRPTPTQAQSSSGPQADATHPVAPVHASDQYKLSDKEAEMVGRGVAPWPYDPRTGKKTDYVGEYAISTREVHMDMMGVPPWPFDPRTGVKTKINTGYSRSNVSQYGMTGVKR